MADGNWAFVIAGYTATWLVVIGYGVYVHRALSRARRRYTQATPSERAP